MGPYVILSHPDHHQSLSPTHPAVVGGGGGETNRSSLYLLGHLLARTQTGK